MKSDKKKLEKKNIWLRVIAVIVALLIWQIVAMCVKLPILLVTPVAVAKRLATIWLEEGFWSSIAFSLVRILGGFFLALILGMIFAYFSYKSDVVKSLLWPYMATIKSVPVASIVVICLLWLSSANLSIFISFLIVLPVIYKNTLTGLESRDLELEDVAKVNGANKWQLIRFVYLPQVAPYLYSAISITAGMAWKAGIAAEIIGTPKGSIGQMLYLSKIYLDTDDMLAWTVVLVLLSIICEKLILLFWKKVICRGIS